MEAIEHQIVHFLEIVLNTIGWPGEETAFFSRLLPIVRTFISLPASIARMPVLRFTVYSFIGSFICCGVLAWAAINLIAPVHQLSLT